MIRLNSFVAIFCVLLFFACKGAYKNNEKIIGYNLSVSSATMTLPDILHEVSGITYVDSSILACIQDEEGILFMYDWKQNEIIKQHAFHIEGDYEGITRVGMTFYVLRSDGTLFEIMDYKSENIQVNSYVTGIPANNNEGLCYDPANNRLLIASKGKIDKGSEYKDKRVIYGFDLTSKTMSEEPVFDFDLQDIKAFAVNQRINLPTRSKKKGKITEPVIKFMTSDIGIHPKTQKLFLLSASDHLLFIFSKKGKIEHIEQLDTELFNKAEGITFLPEGDMFITNEGQNGRPTLLYFNYKR